MDALVKEEEGISQRIYAISEKLQKAKAKAATHERARQIIANMEADLALRQRMQGALKGRVYALQMEILRDVVSKADVVRLFEYLLG